MHSTFSKSALFTDFYELTMAQGYWKQNMNHPVVFDMFFRRQPFNGGFSVFAGIEPLLDSLEDFSFDEDEISYLREQDIFEEGFLEYLKGFKFSGDLYSFEEGSVIFPQEPLVRIHANLIEAQIIEGLVLNLCNFQSLIATKTARVWLSSKKSCCRIVRSCTNKVIMTAWTSATPQISCLRTLPAKNVRSRWGTVIIERSF